MQDLQWLRDELTEIAETKVCNEDYTINAEATKELREHELYLASLGDRELADYFELAA